MKYIPGPDLTPVDRNPSKTHPRSPRSPSLTFSSHCSTTGKSNSLSQPADLLEVFFDLEKKKKKRIITFLQGFFLHERQRQASNNTQQHESWLLRYSLMSNPSGFLLITQRKWLVLFQLHRCFVFLNTYGAKVSNSSHWACWRAEGGTKICHTVIYTEVEISDRNPNGGERPRGTRAPTLAVRPSLAQRGSLIPVVLWGHRCPPSVLRLAL